MKPDSQFEAYGMSVRENGKDIESERRWKKRRRIQKASSHDPDVLLASLLWIKYLPVSCPSLSRSGA